MQMQPFSCCLNNSRILNTNCKGPEIREWGFWGRTSSLYLDNRIRLTQLCIWLELCRTSGDKSPRQRFIFATLWQLAGEHLSGGVLYLSAMCAVDGMTVMHNLACAENILRSSSGSAVRSHPLLDWRRLSRGTALSESQPPLNFSFHLGFSFLPPSSLWRGSRCMTVFLPRSLRPCTLEKLQIDYKPSPCQD